MSVQTSVSTSPAVAFAGMLADDAANDIITMVNEEASASIPFGVCVSIKESSPASDKGVILPTASYVKVAGIVVHRHNYSRTFTLPDGTVAGELDSTGLVPGTTMSLLRRGRIWVKVQQAVVPGDRPFICKTVGAGNAYTALGQFGNADDTTGSGATLSLANLGQYLTTAAALGFAKLEIDFTNKP